MRDFMVTDNRTGQQRAIHHKCGRAPELWLGLTLLVIASQRLTRRTPYAHLGPDCFDRRDAVATERRLVARLERLRFDITLTLRVA